MKNKKSVCWSFDSHNSFQGWSSTDGGGELGVLFQGTAEEEIRSITNRGNKESICVL
jgi:hypothetical protein